MELVNCKQMSKEEQVIKKRFRYKNSLGVYTTAEIYDDHVDMQRDEFNLPFRYSRQTFEKIIKARLLTLRDGKIVELSWKKLTESEDILLNEKEKIQSHQNDHLWVLT